MIQLLTKLTSDDIKFKWSLVEKYEFEDMKLIVTHNLLVSYPDVNKWFEIHTD